MILFLAVISYSWIRKAATVVLKADYDHLYLSPHLDDVVLSCGGLIRKQTLAGQKVLVVTLFAGTPSYEGLSLFARLLHLSWGNPRDPVEVRCREDEAALDHLGAHFLHLHFLDALYRRAPYPLYPSNRALCGELHAKDRGLQGEVEALLERLVARLKAPSLYAPLAVGHHVDHQVARRTADSLRQRGYRVTYYEDSPYVEKEEALLLALGDREGWSPTLEVITHTIEDKIKAIGLYRSQIFVLFRRKEAMERRVRAYASSLAPERAPCERYWKRI